MAGTSLILPDGAPPPGARTLGLRTAPSLRLSIGFRNPQRNNAPDKLDHFRAKEGAQGEFKSAATKFHKEYGDAPKSIDVRLPLRLEDALRIEYLAFKGSRDDPLGGVMVARGQTNFAPLGYCGGPDTLTVWDEDGTVRHVATKGIDALTREPLDEVAASTGLMLCTTLRVGLPKVLGYGAFAEITSKSLISTDRLWAKLVEWYAAFPNGAASIAMRPLLVVKPAVSRPVVKGKRIRSRVYVLDLVQPESEDEMIARLERHRGALQFLPGDIMPRGELEAGEPELPEGAAAFSDDVEEITDAEIIDDSGPDPVAAGGESLPSGSEHIDTAADPTPPTQGGGVELDEITEVASVVSQTDAEGTTPPPASVEVGEEPVLRDDDPQAPADLSPEDVAAAERAAKVIPPFGAYQTRSLGQIVRNSEGVTWIAWALKRSVNNEYQAADAQFERALWAFVKMHLPDLYAMYKDLAK